MKEKKPTAGLTLENLIKVGTFVLWSILGVVLVAGIRTLFYKIKFDWLSLSGAIGVPAFTLLWGLAKQRIDAVAKTAKENKEQIALKFDSLNNAIDRLTIQQQGYEKLREQVTEGRIEIERLKSDINTDKRLGFLEQIIHRFTANEKKDTNH